MAEKGIIVSDDASGESVACYDAVENDNDSNARIVQIVDQSQRKTGIVISTSTGEMRTGVTASDSTVVTTVPAAITSTALTIGDKNLFVCVGHYKISAAADVTITPIILDPNNHIIGTLSPKIISAYQPDGGTAITEPFHFIDGSDAWNVTEMVSWNVLGGYKIGAHVAFASVSGLITGALNLYGAMITGPATGGAAVATLTNGAYSTKTSGGGG